MMDMKEILITGDAYSALKAFSEKIEVDMGDVLTMSLNLLMTHQDEIVMMHQIKRNNPHISYEEMIEMMSLEEGDDLH